MIMADNLMVVVLVDSFSFGTENPAGADHKETRNNNNKNTQEQEVLLYVLPPVFLGRGYFWSLVLVNNNDCS
jgi:hypothetical protein